MYKDILFYKTRLSNSEDIGFIRGRGMAILVERDAYPRSSFAKGARVIYKDREYKITDVEKANALTYPPKESNVICLIVKEIRDEEKASV